MPDFFSFLVLEALVPIKIQNEAPDIIDLWNRIIRSSEGEAALREIWQRVLSSMHGTSDVVSAMISENDFSILLLKDNLYDFIKNNPMVIHKIIGRVVTYGNEQCPYWNNFAYTLKPNASMRFTSDDKIFS